MKTICSKNHFNKILKSFRKKLDKTETYSSLLSMNVPNLHQRTDILFEKLEHRFSQTVQGQDRKTKSRFTDGDISLEYNLTSIENKEYIILTYRFTKTDKPGFVGILTNGTHRILKQKIYLGLNA